MSSIIVVSNRLPFVLKRSDNGSLWRSLSAGGLVTALAPVVGEINGLWIGWPGMRLEDKDTIPEGDLESCNPAERLGPEQLRAVNVDDNLFDAYYNGCCNTAFWPLFHSMPCRALFTNEGWASYSQVNCLFGQKTFATLKSYVDDHPETSPPLIWIHDYQLMLVGDYLRNRVNESGIVNCKIAFFLHIPFPPWDVFRLFPWYDEILVGLLGCNLIGFHTDGYVGNFLECCVQGLECHVDRDKQLIQYDGRIIRVQAFPIGVPFERFEETARAVKNEVVPHPDCKIILGVDRLDYTKGIVNRVRAFEKLLEKYPEYVDEVVLVQVAVPSRTDVKEYAELKDELDREVGRINGRFSTSSWSPIRYIYQCLKQEVLCALYRDAWVALVTPIRDGMNLVAKEFVACQIENPGVLILSPFTGAGETMHEALICNPLDENGLVDTMHRALNMPLCEREMRMSALRRRERTNDVHNWVKTFLQATTTVEDNGECSLTQPLNIAHIEKWLAKYVGDSMKLLLLLDYDGTLAPIASHPDRAHLPEETKQILENLVAMSEVYVAVISGRNVDNLKSMVGIEGITYAGNHGIDILQPDDTRFTHPDQLKYSSLISVLAEELEGICLSVNGAWVETKGSTLTMHYRNVDEEKRPAVIDQTTRTILKLSCKPVQALCAVEARPPIMWDKGRASLHLLRTTVGSDWSKDVRIIYVGDDTTDEDAMAALKGIAATFRVTNSRTVKTSAKYRIHDIHSVLTLLRWVRYHFQREIGGKRIINNNIIH